MFNGVALLVQRYISNTASFVVCVVHSVKDHLILPNDSPLLKSTRARQVVLDKWFPQIIIIITIVILIVILVLILVVIINSNINNNSINTSSNFKNNNNHHNINNHSTSNNW